MADVLTPQQARAVFDRGGKLLVSAAAGSGKTKVLVDRLMRYLTDEKDPANLDEFLIITYTKAAASELRGKIAAKLSQAMAEQPQNRHLHQQMQRLYLTKISTVHAFCSDILREYAYRLDISGDFRVGDENECTQLRDSVMADVLEQAYDNATDDPDFCAFVDTQGLGRNDRAVPEILLNIYDRARCHLDPQGWLMQSLEQMQMGSNTDASETIWGEYLIEDLWFYLDLQIKAMENSAAQAAKIPEYAKPAAILADELYQLKKLRSSQSWDEIVHNKQISYGVLRFPKKDPDPDLSERIKAVRNGCKSGLAKKLRSFADSAELVMEDLEKSAAAVRGLIALVNTFDAAYSRAKRARRILDFSDLEHETLDLLLGKRRTGPTAAANEIGSRFREIMVDEYQDSNGVQDAIFGALTAQRQNCFMVGDVKQSIYQFRLADPGIFLEKYQSYVPADQAVPGEGRKVMLSSNFRSGGAVLEASNDVFRRCMSPRVGGLHYGEEEALREGIPHIPLDEPEVELYAIDVQEDTYAEEAAFTARRICELLDGKHMVRQGDQLRPIIPDDIVILLRSPGSVGGQFQAALERRGLRCVTGSGVNLLETEEIGTLRALLQTISNPRQDIPLLGVLASPLFGYTANDLARIRAMNRRLPFYDVLKKDDSPKTVHFLAIMTRLRQEAAMSTLTQLLEGIYAETHLQSLYAAMPGGEQRLANLETFYQLAVDYESSGSCDLLHFLQHLDSMEEKGLIAAGEQSNSGCITIMSIHKSKGLEFPVVFLCGLSKKFNREDLKGKVLSDRELGLGLSAVDAKNRIYYPTISKQAIVTKAKAESLSEEMRVLYVAMTRARDRLIMTYASDSLQSDLKDIALRMDLGGADLLSAEAACAGDWVLLTAMNRMESGELFAVGGRPDSVSLGNPPWKVSVVQGSLDEGGQVQRSDRKQKLPEGLQECLSSTLRFTYPYAAATKAPSKQTATQRKGREKDKEAAEKAEEPLPVIRAWRKPSFRSGEVQGKDYGSAFHAALQYIRYEACTSEEMVSAEIQRLIDQRFLTPEQGEMIDCRKIAAFFRTELGCKLRDGRVLREFKFSILDAAESYGALLEGEQVLLQGVVDCALLEPDGITILDFKTDRVTLQNISKRVEHYKPQVDAYAQALQRIYQMPIKRRFLYFFHAEQLVAVD